MKASLVEKLVCPSCRSPKLSLGVEAGNADNVETGRISCDDCAREYPIVNGIPRLLPEASWYFDEAVDGGGPKGDRAEAMRQTVTRYSSYQGKVYAPLSELLNNAAILEARTGFKAEDFEGRLCLDAGCGAGRMSRVMARGGAQVIAMDAGFAVDKAKSKTEPDANIEWIQADILRPPFKEGLFDRVLSIGVLHHTVEPDVGFAGLANLLTDTGTLSVYLYPRPHADWRHYGSARSVLSETKFAIYSEPTRRFIAQLPDGARLLVCKALYQRRRVVEQVRKRGPVGAVLAQLADFATIPDVYKPLENAQSNITRNFDMYSTPYNFTHQLSEVIDWYESDGRITDVLITPYRLAMTGTRGPRTAGDPIRLSYHASKSLNSVAAQGREAS